MIILAMIMIIVLSILAVLSGAMPDQLIDTIQSQSV